MQTLQRAVFGLVVLLPCCALAGTNAPPAFLAATNLPPGTVLMPAQAAPARVSRVMAGATRANLLAASSNRVSRVHGPPHIKAVPGGGRAEFGLSKVFFPADANGARPLTVTGPDGGRVAFRARMLSWQDTSTGQRWLLAQITNRVGVIVQPDQIVYTNAFDNVRADLRYHYSRRGALEQDVILRERPTLPAGLLAEHARLEVWTEWFDSVPTARQTQAIDLRQGSGLTNAGPAVVADEGLTFGRLRVGAGYAFSTGTPGEKTPVAKTWARVDGRDWLVETVDYPALKRKLDALGGSGTRRTAQAGTSREDLIAALAPMPRSAGVSPVGSLVALAQPAGADASAPGVVLDFAILSCVPVPPGAISWWPAGGNANDALSGNDGCLINNVGYAAGEVGQGFYFNGYDENLGDGDSVQIGDAPNLNPTNALTIDAWIYFPADVQGWNMPIVNKDSWSGRQYLLTKTSDDKLRAHVGITNGVFYYTDGQAVLQPDTWYHVAMTYSAADSNLAIYVNGTLDTNVLVQGSMRATSEPLYLGGAPAWWYWWKGGIDEVDIFDRALSAAELKTIYDAGTAGKINPNCVAAPANLAAWFPGDAHGYDIAGTNVAVLHNGANYAAAVAAHGFHFDGDDDHATAADDPALNFAAGEDFSLELWLKAEATEIEYDYGVQTLVSKRQVADGVTVMGWELFLLDGLPGLQIADAPLREWNWATYIAEGPDLRDGGWHHLAVTVDRDDEAGGHLYVDGAMVMEFDPTVMPGALTNALPLLVGVHPDSGLHCNFGGVLDEISVYHRALDGTEISQLYEAGGAGKCKVDTDNDGMQDWWEMKYFGTLDQVGTDQQGANWDYDGDGVSNYAEFAGHTDPNKIKALLQFTNLWVSTVTPGGAVEVLAGVPSQIAVQVNDTNFAAAVWGNYSSNFTANLSSMDGIYQVWVGLRGRAEDSQQTWLGMRLTLDRTPPLLVITNPASSTGSVPMIQLQGYCPEPLESLRFDVTNAAGVITNQQAFVSDQVYDTNLFAFTTNYFQGYDIFLTNGVNTVTFHATDLAGNTTVTNFSFTLETDTNAPVLSLTWPQDGMRLCGTNFTMDGLVDDATAAISLAIFATNGITNLVAGAVERHGRFWLENVPLSSGTNWLTLTAMDAWSNAVTTNIIVIKSDLELSVTGIPTNELHEATVTINGTLTNTGYTVWVNGVQAGMSGGNWHADHVPVSAGATATFAVTAYPPGENPTPDPNNLTLNPPSANATQARVPVDQPRRVWFASDWQGQWVTQHIWAWNLDGILDDERILRGIYNQFWGDGLPSDAMAYDYRWYMNGGNPITTLCTKRLNWPPSTWEAPSDGRQVCSNGCVCDDPIASLKVSEKIAGEHCDVSDPFTLQVFNFLDSETYWRGAQTQVKLFTGGKAFPVNKSLFVGQGSAQEILLRRASPPYRPPWLWPEHQRGVTNQDVILGDFGPLGSDGFAYKVFGDGETHDITPRAKSKPFYKFSADASKHVLVHQTVAQAKTNRDRNRTTVGVGEEVSFYFDPPLGMHDPEQHEWSTTAGSVEMVGPQEWGLHGSWAWFTSPSNATTATVTVKVRDAELDPIPFTVKAPEGYDSGLTRIVNTYPSNTYAYWQVAAKMKLEVIIRPTDVSFYRVEMMEEGRPASGVEGYFTNFTSESLFHNTSGVFTNVQPNNALPDMCWWGPTSWGTPGHPAIGGGFYWVIPAKWKIGSGDANDLSEWGSPQEFLLTGDGTLTIKKFGLQVSRGTNGVVVPSISPSP